MKRSKSKTEASKSEKASTSKPDAAASPETDAAAVPAAPKQPRPFLTLLVGGLGFFSAALSSLEGFSEYSTQSHVVAFSISLVLALALGLSPGAKDFLERWTWKDPARKVNYKKAVVGWLLVLVPIGATFGWTGPSGAVTVAGLAFSVAAFSE